VSIISKKAKHTKEIPGYVDTQTYELNPLSYSSFPGAVITIAHAHSLNQCNNELGLRQESSKSLDTKILTSHRFYLNHICSNIENKYLNQGMGWIK
jgi:hypothetical protein